MNKERKSFGAMIETNGAINKVKESYEGFIPVDEVPEYARATRYTCPYTGKPRTYLEYTTVSPVKTVTIYEGEKDK